MYLRAGFRVTDITNKTNAIPKEEEAETGKQLPCLLGWGVTADRFAFGSLIRARAGPPKCRSDLADDSSRNVTAHTHRPVTPPPSAALAFARLLRHLHPQPTHRHDGYM
jgi:hypothetical protein